MYIIFARSNSAQKALAEGGALEELAHKRKEVIEHIIRTDERDELLDKMGFKGNEQEDSYGYVADDRERHHDYIYEKLDAILSDEEIDMYHDQIASGEYSGAYQQGGAPEPEEPLEGPIEGEGEEDYEGEEQLEDLEFEGEEPPVARTQFEDETFEFEDGGEVEDELEPASAPKPKKSSKKKKGKGRGNAPMMKMISSRAKKIRRDRPTMKWIEAIKEASKQLKKEGKL